jgi:hypothetical protein
MTFTLGLVLTADANSAKAEMRATASEARDLGQATTTAGQNARSAGAGVRGLGAAASRAEVNVRGLASAEAVATAQAQRLNQTHRLAGGGVANLTAQFNDIGVMLAAGQNPLQLAIQQGTQITQVIGPLGAAGAARALTSAFVGMINPVSLITIGSIAAGAALLQWVTGAGEKVPTLEEAVDDLGRAVDAYAKSGERALMSTAALREEFGGAAESARAMMQDISEADRRRAERAVGAALEAVSNELQINIQRPDMGDQDRLGDVFDLSIWSRAARKEINTVLNAFAKLDKAATLDAQLQAATELAAKFKRAAEASGDISVSEDTVLGALHDQISAMQRLIAKKEQFEKRRTVAAIQQFVDPYAKALGEGFDRFTQARDLTKELQDQSTLQALINKYGRDSAEVSNARLDAERTVYAAMLAQKNLAQTLKQELLALWDAANPRRDPFQEQIEAAQRYYGETRKLGLIAAQSAEQELETLLSANTAHEAALRFGKDSIQVAELQAAAARSTYEEYLATLDVASALKTEMLAAYDNGAALAAVELAVGVGAAANEALRLADNLGISLATAARLAALGPQGTAQTQPGRADPRSQGGSIQDWQTTDADAFLRNWKPPQTNRSGGRSGRGSGDPATRELEQQREALADLIESQEQELAILRQTDPVQQEMLRNREVLAGATQTERDQVEQLIAARLQEGAAMQRLEFISATTGDALIDALMGGADAGEQLIETLKRAVLQAAILGNGSLGGLFGGGILGDAFGGFFGGGELSLFDNIGGLASGGMVHGPGTGTSDDVLMWGSNGEFMVNAKATAKYRHLLEAMNSGSPIPGFASGGAIGGASSGPGLSGSGLSGSAAPQFHLDLRGVQGSSEIEDRARAGVRAALAEYDQFVLPRRVEAIARDPRRRN